MGQLVFQDQMIKLITLDSYPERIVSLVPSQTELLFYLGLEDKIVGRTKFCIHPQDKVNSVQIIGGTKNPRLREIISLEPNIVIGNKEENEINTIIEIEELFPVWMSDIKTIDDALDMINRVGQLTNTSKKALQLIIEIKDKISELEKLKEKTLGKTCLYLIWKDPYMGVGSNTFVNDVIKRCGFSNIIEQKERYPQLEMEEIIEMSPDYIFLSSEPYPFKKKNVQDFEQLLPGTKVLLVDGEMFSWYGNRMLKSIPYLNDLIVNL
jgi:ABC-type Fe3+-hydroxamate transport system substrate-binding protein